MNLFIASVQRDLLVHFRHPSEVLNPLVFFIVVISLFPLGIGPEPGQLKEIAPGIVWVAALLATLMSMDSMFRSDFEDGSLEQIVLSEQSTFIFVLAKVVSHWLLSGLPLVLLNDKAFVYPVASPGPAESSEPEKGARAVPPC